SVKSLIERNYARARSLLMENMDILHSMKNALMKYETIDAPQIDDLMNRQDVRPPAGWDDANKGNSPEAGGTPKAPTSVEESHTPSPGTNHV
ncbi:MAG: ATP-dependent metalloprotease, partial [Serratia symbiotica]|nr:ATP-dependent metalloprotease [Serratia symbiotica]